MTQKRQEMVHSDSLDQLAEAWRTTPIQAIQRLGYSGIPPESRANGPENGGKRKISRKLDITCRHALKATGKATAAQHLVVVKVPDAQMAALTAVLDAMQTQWLEIDGM